jgi:uncharacterized membrane protein
MSRILRHLTSTGWGLRRAFSVQALSAIEQAIAQAERSHGGEIRFVIEGGFHPIELLRGVTPRERALHAFARLGVWDTAANNGVLIYVLWAERDVEIVADRGFNGLVSAAEWGDVCHRMETLFAQGLPHQAAIEGVRAAGELIARHYPSADRDELSNRPVLL